MLMQSTRHRPEDLELWKELEEADYVHGQRLLKSGKIERSIHCIREFVSRGPCYVGLSGGKDSTAVFGLLRLAQVEIAGIYIRAIPTANPDCQVVCESLSAIVVDANYGSLPAEKWKAEQDGDRVFFSICDQLGKLYGRRILGVRASESRSRLIRMARWGESSLNACAPIGWWSTQDVFGFLAIQKLPVHSAYGMLGGGRWPRDRIRVDELCGASGDGSGRREWELEYYGDVIRQLEASTIG